MNFVLALIALSATLCADPPAYLLYDPARIVTNETAKCAMCHQGEVDAWMASKHKRTYDERHWTRKAKAINKRLGDRSLKRSNECVLCHYTETTTVYNDRGRHVQSGVSCQRCHGAAAEWYPAHDTGVDAPSFAERAVTLETLGMRHRFSLYELYATCYQCHAVPREKLVNDGRHPPGSLKFELLSWSEGEVRHRFATRDGVEHKNAQAPQAHRRFVFVLGQALELEYGLRAMAYAEEKGRYVRNQRKRVVAAHNALVALDLDIPEIKQMLEVSTTLLDHAPYAGLPLEGGEEYARCAKKIGRWAHELENKRDDYGEEFAKVDSVLPKKFQGSVYQTMTAAPR